MVEDKSFSLAAQKSLACLHDFEYASLDIIFRRILSETDSAGAQRHISRHAHGGQRGADFAAVARCADRKSDFVFERMLDLVADNSRERHADDLQDLR